MHRDDIPGSDLFDLNLGGPLTAANLFAHLVYGAADAAVRHTVARGRVVLRDFRHTTLDPADLAARAREAAPALWDRFHAIPWGTSFLG